LVVGMVPGCDCRTISCLGNAGEEAVANVSGECFEGVTRVTRFTSDVAGLHVEWNPEVFRTVVYEFSVQSAFAVTGTVVQMGDFDGVPEFEQHVQERKRIGSSGNGGEDTFTMTKHAVCGDGLADCFDET
jgi:hypothetical protein